LSKSEDIHTLYRRFGGDAASYQEIVSSDQADAAEKHWPLLGQLKPLSHGEAPAAKRSVEVGERMAQMEVVIYKTKTVPQIVHVVAEKPVPADEPPVKRVTAPVPEPREVAPAIAPETVSPVATQPQWVKAVAPMVPPSAPVVPVASSSDLKSVFNRLVPPAPKSVETPVASPLKRLIKW